VVQKAAMRVWDEHVSFVDAAQAAPEIAKRLDARALERLFDPSHVLRHVAAIIDRALAEAG
jgi:adenylosuccinate lyase